MNFHNKYYRVNKWYEQAEFKLTNNHMIKTAIVGFNYEDDYGKIDIYGNITAKAGFYFGASGPTFDTKSSREASCLHDLIYWFNQVGAFRRTYDGHIPDNEAMRKEADLILYELCLWNGMWQWRAELWYGSVREFGEAAWSADPNK